MRDDAAGPRQGDSKKLDFALLIEAAHRATDARIESQDHQLEVPEPSAPTFPDSERTDG